ncbi:ribosome biogenesis factor YjgA [Methylibium sp.]|uniref:ribosome biogenesis factor YjgA n=1 Tax=Methylibium sp. TaxID=2067992 RepID=UPI0025E3A375|nr:ribosome biogenesis factor YjgA [Methylibium sp.]
MNSAPTPDAGTERYDFERPSKTSLKKAMHELQALGEALLLLPDSRIDAIGLPESLRDAVRTAQRTKTHEGRRRQMQYLGKLMGKADKAAVVEPVREAVAAFQLGHAKDALALHHAERWRAELIADDDALTRWTAEHPGGDVQQLRSLIRSARKEGQAHEAALPGEALRHGRAYRELFKLLRTALTENETDR